MISTDPMCPVCGGHLRHCIDRNTGRHKCRHLQIFGGYGYYEQIEDWGKMGNSLKRLELALLDHMNERKTKGKPELIPHDLYDILEENTSTQTMVKLAEIILKLKTNR